MPQVKRITRGLLITLLVIVSHASHAAVVTSFSNLLIGGEQFNATVHTTEGFDELYNAGADASFGDGSLMHGFTFTNVTMAQLAATAVRGALGTADEIEFGNDLFSIAFAGSFDGTATSYSYVNGDNVGDLDIDGASPGHFVVGPDGDIVGNLSVRAAVSFVRVADTSVPIPNSMLLMAAGLIGLGVVRRRRSNR